VNETTGGVLFGVGYDAAHDGAFGGVVYDDGLTGVADGFEDDGKGAGIGGGKVADGFDVGEEGEGRKAGITASGFSLGMMRMSAWERASAGRAVGRWVERRRARERRMPPGWERERAKRARERTNGRMPTESPAAVGGGWRMASGGWHWVSPG
jgi:hypothetical protein